ncbi:MAG TPA: methylated-DNA--[protein]-cysteine S-methyltransferase [Candidatus Krumholzibacteria bacterium]|nr:methylated-DNA--[protein]-cysteine S-methyltransferase [Candidatus Krumholzibacteria bacterium]HRX50774.1 methylated-DNA--[protein]-cysteine S-methyltransferase [Candidatus Krumholzibacteria bacterium]
MYRYALLRTVLDPLLAVGGDAGLLRLEFLPRAYQYHTHAHAVVHAVDPDAEPAEDPAAFEDLRRQLAEYFTGRRERFDARLDPHGTPFQQTVWTELRRIPYGRLRTYGEVARAIGRPKATRAVGQAAGQNPLPILIPCHRVVGRDGGLVGFAGGLTVKARLLRLEGHTLGDGTRLEEPQLF